MLPHAHGARAPRGPDRARVKQVFDGDTCTYSKRLLPRGRAFSLGERPRTIVETPEPCNRWPMPPTDYNWRSHAQPGIVPGAPGSRRAGVAQGTWYAATLVKMAPRGWPSPGGGHMQYEPARFNRTPRDARPARPFTHASVRAANAHYLKGLQWLERDFPFRGEAELERALGADPNHVAAMGLLAKLKLKLRSDYNGAARLFEKALALDEGNAMVPAPHPNLHPTAPLLAVPPTGPRHIVLTAPSFRGGAGARRARAARGVHPLRLRQGRGAVQGAAPSLPGASGVCSGS